MSSFDYRRIFDEKDPAERTRALESLWQLRPEKIPDNVLEKLREIRTDHPKATGLLGLLLCSYGSLGRDPAVMVRVFLGVEAGPDLQKECVAKFAGIDLRQWTQECSDYYWTEDERLSDSDFYYFQQFFGKYGELEMPSSLDELIRRLHY